jgi:serralysin
MPLARSRNLIVSLCALSLLFFSCASGFAPNGRWSQTALDGSLGGAGMPARLTWSIVPDGTLMDDGSPSNFIAKMDATWGAGSGGSDLTKRPWFPLLAESFGRWGEVGGISLSYSPYDDAAPWGTVPGVLNKRGDIRIGGRSIDGRLNVLGRSESPSNGDMVIDTDDMNYFSGGESGAGRFRNHILHELGHGLGLGHIMSNTGTFLLEPSNNAYLMGPQFDDILGLHQLYGDRYEEPFGPAGNGSISQATNLGVVSPGSIKRIGVDIGFNTTIPLHATDFVSISNQFDADFFSFRLSSNSETSIALVPVGASYDHMRQGGTPSIWNTATFSNLSLALFDDTGSQIALAADAPKGALELINNISLSANRNYYVRVTGDSHLPQFYHLYISASQGEGSSTLFRGDFNGDGIVDAADYSVWRNSLGQTGAGLAADADANNRVDIADYLIWKTNLGIAIPSQSTFLAGDFNRDGMTNAADYTVWRNSLGSIGPNLLADANGDYKVDQLDYLVWKQSFDAYGVGALQGVSHVPSPGGSTVGLVAVALGLVLRWRSRRRK